MEKNLHFDICVVGGGMVGTTLVELLANEFPQTRLCLVEQHAISISEELYQPGFDERCTALSIGSAEVFSALGLWSEMLTRATEINSVHVSDKGHFGFTDFTQKDFTQAESGERPLGYVVENAWIGRCLNKALAKLNNIEVFAPAKVEHIDIQARGANLQLEFQGKKKTVFADLIIIADGAHSTLRKQLGIDVQVKHYEQYAVIANVETSEAHRGRAFERFTSEGPVALLPLGGDGSADNSSHKSALVYTRPQEKINGTMALDDSAFLAQLQETFGYRQGKFLRAGKRSSYPLSLSIAKEQVRSSIVLMGNAAHFLHPVAGQGFNLALRDATQLLAALKPVYLARLQSKTKASETEARFGELAALMNYLEIQTKDQELTSTISDTFNTLFSNNNRLKQVGRNLGLLALELSDGLKREVFHRMMGQQQARAPLQVFGKL